MKTISAPLPFLASLCGCLHFAGKETPAPSDPDLYIIFIGLEKETIHRVIKISVCAFIIQRTVLHFGKSVPNRLRQICHYKVTADLAECPTDIFCFSWDGSNRMKRKKEKRDICVEGGTLHRLCADKIKAAKVILGWLIGYRGAISI